MLDKKHNMCYIINRPEEVNKIEKEMSDMTLEDKIKNGEFLNKDLVDEDEKTEQEVEKKLQELFKD